MLDLKIFRSSFETDLRNSWLSFEENKNSPLLPPSILLSAKIFYILSSRLRDLKIS